MTVEPCPRLNRQHIVQDVAFDAGRAGQRDRVGFDLSDDFAMHEAVIGHDRAIDAAGFADRQLRTMDIARENAVDLDFAVADDIARNLHAGAEDGRCAGGPFIA